MTDRAGFREAIMILRGLLAKPYFCSKFRVRAAEAILSLFHVIFFRQGGEKVSDHLTRSSDC